MTLLETLPEILQDKTDEETNLQEDPIKQIRHSRMNQTSLRNTYENSACIQMTSILSAKSHANSLISSLRMMNPTEELREGKGIEKTLLETLLGIIQDKTDEETNLQEDPIKQIRHSRMDVSYIKTTSGLTVELIQPTPVATGKTMTEDEVGGKNTDAIVEDSLRNLRQVHHQDGGRKITESVETTPSPSVHPEVLTSPSELNAKNSNTRPFEKKRMMMNPK